MNQTPDRAVNAARRVAQLARLPESDRPADRPRCCREPGTAAGRAIGWPEPADGLGRRCQPTKVGNSMFGGSSSIVFSAGPAHYRDGLVGKLTPAG
jgi:hypothetical protein